MVPATIALITIVILWISAGSKNTAVYNGKTYSTIVSSPEDFQRIAEFFNLEISSSPQAEQQVVIPLTFNDIYQQYNALQEKIGLDLSPYRGKTCTKYTFVLPSLPSQTERILTLLVYDHHLIGGDICGMEYGSTVTSIS